VNVKNFLHKQTVILHAAVTIKLGLRKAWTRNILRYEERLLHSSVKN